MIDSIFQFYKPAPFIERLPDDKISEEYKGWTPCDRTMVHMGAPSV